MEYLDYIDPRQEAEDFEAGAEDMELRAMRLEAERAMDVEAAMYEAEEEACLEAALDDIGATRAEYEAVCAFSNGFQAFLFVPPTRTSDDDIPF